ncbi:hypothetical protein NX059_011149 [Plenodomus lindquistii]|nr:hypothetical protein NX059_011149 [Plenodomus lindquistii]
MPMSFTSTDLRTAWTFKKGDQTSKDVYAEANNLPTEIHRDLLKHGRIADPFLNLNELSCRWVGDEAWTYRTAFMVPTNNVGSEVVTTLKFEGLDTFATVYLNGEEILISDNMFTEHRVDVSKALKREENVLEIVFDSARKKGLKLVERYKDHRFIVHQTEISRGPVRKAQYHWGWDWGPILMTCGPWKPIYIETFTGRIYELRANYTLDHDLNSATVNVTVKHEGNVGAVKFSIVDPKNDRAIATECVEVNSTCIIDQAGVSFTVKNIQLWWPQGYGGQPLYTVQAEAFTAVEPERQQLLHSISRKTGFRKVELIQEPDNYGRSFYFRINDVDIFCGGSCWIPADSFLTRITPQEYRDWVELAAAGNQTMLRVWGGGIYEADALYDAADEFGLLVWQDFTFACANYPAQPGYLDSITVEATQNVRRLRHHPSLVIWAGNNEDYQIVERYKLDYDTREKDPQAWLKTNFPARYIYEHLLPEIVQIESPNVPYHPSSPFGNGESTVLKVDPTIGDVHQWNMWHGTMEPYQRLPEMGGRFVSEFGMEAYPHVSTLESCLTEAKNRQPGSMAMDFRNKAIGHERRLLSYVAENFRLQYDLESFTHLTQIMQADAMLWAYKSWRRQWGSKGHRKCGGALVWQLNDCWPTISWAVVDYHRVPKPAYYAIKRAMEPITINVQRKYRSWTLRPADGLWQRDTGHIDMEGLWKEVEYEVWVSNNTLKQYDGEVHLRYISIKGGHDCHEQKSITVVVAANGTTEVLKDSIRTLDVKDDSDGVSRRDPFVISASLCLDGRRRIESDPAWPDPIKYLPLQKPIPSLQYSKDKSRVNIQVNRPVKGFTFAEKKGVKLSDNGFDLVPYMVKEVVVEGCQADELEWRYIEM